MPRAKFVPDTLKTVAMHNKQRNKFCFIYVRRWQGI